MAIEIGRLSKSFGKTQVLRDVSLSVAKGELVALLGPSGSGKTTLLKIISGLEWPDAGTLSVDGEDWLALAARERRTGFVFQHYALFPHMRVRDNIAFGLDVRPRAERPGAAEIARRVDELLDLLQIGELGARYPAQLSGGQRQRVALGRALAIEPRVLLLDEPFGALDAAVRRDLRRWLRGVHDATGSTTIFVTHDQDEAFELADRVVIMGAGRIEQAGTADEIHDRPATPFVARFMGATVEFPARVRAGRAEAEGIALPNATTLPDGAARLFARPSDLLPEADPAGPWRVGAVASTGAVLRAVLADDAGRQVELELPRRAPEAAALVRNARVRLSAAAGAVFPTVEPGRATAPAGPREETVT